MQPLGVHHVSINVTDVEAALAFYTGVLGLTERSDRPDFGFDGAWLDVGAGGQQLHLIGGPAPPSLGQHFAVRVADLPATLVELRARGLEVTDASPVGPGHQAFLTDPSGNTVELYAGPGGPVTGGAR